MNHRIVIRGALALGVLIGGWISLGAFESHVQAPGPLLVTELVKPLAELPLQLGDWKGSDRPITDEKTLYADQHLQRLYVNVRTQQSVLVWLAYSRDGEDRGHHPEVCMAVAGRPEDASERQTFPAPGHIAPIQQYRFGTPGDRQWVYYWHYTLTPPKTAETTELQRFYQRLHRRPSSITLEVFAPESRPTDGEHAREFALLLDEAIQSHLVPTATRGSQRLPVTVIQGEDAPPTVAH
jgi:hypothetical protein